MQRPDALAASVREAELRRAFMAGFAVSGEGFNGEYPFDGDREQIDNALDGAFKEWRGDVPAS